MATLSELAVVLGVAGTVTASAIPRLLTGLDDARAAGAARYVSSRLAEARMQAVGKNREVAIRFTASGGRYTFTTYEDGNKNGVLTRDIRRGIDRATFGPEALSDNFRNVDFGVRPGVPSIDPAGAPPDGDPIKLGVGNSVSFSKLGTATPGTVYLVSASGAQYAVRVFGVTGKIRVYHFIASSGKWLPM